MEEQRFLQTPESVSSVRQTGELRPRSRRSATGAEEVELSAGSFSRLEVDDVIFLMDTWCQNIIVT